MNITHDVNSVSFKHEIFLSSSVETVKMSRQTTKSLFVLVLFCLSLIPSRTDGLSCGICGVDVICKDRYPICSTHQIITLDYCGCCLVCKNILELGEECSKDLENYAVCKSGLECINSKCADVKTSSG